MSNNLPKTLYRYRRVGENLNYALREIYGELWCSYANNLNDPFDGIQFTSQRDDIRSYKINAKKELKFPVKKKWCIACFSETWQNAPMWAHYADNYSGICIGYSVDSINKMIEERNTVRNENPTIENHLVKVDYYEKFPEHFENDLQRIKSKTTDWEYEKEWRLVTQGTGGDSPSKGTYFSPKVLNSKLVITEIMYGFNCDTTTRKVLWELNNSILPNVPIMAVAPNKNEAGLIREI